MGLTAARWRRRPIADAAEAGRPASLAEVQAGAPAAEHRLLLLRRPRAARRAVVLVLHLRQVITRRRIGAAVVFTSVTDAGAAPAGAGESGEGIGKVRDVGATIGRAGTDHAVFRVSSMVRLLERRRSER